MLVTLSLLVDAENLRHILGHDEKNTAEGDTSEPTFAPSDGGNCFRRNDVGLGGDLFAASRPLSLQLGSILTCFICTCPLLNIDVLL